MTGLKERKPAPISAAFSSSCVGSLIGDLARDGCDATFANGRSHIAAAFLTDGDGSVAWVLVLSSRSIPFSGTDISEPLDIRSPMFVFLGSDGVG